MLELVEAGQLSNAQIAGALGDKIKASSVSTLAARWKLAKEKSLGK